MLKTDVLEAIVKSAEPTGLTVRQCEVLKLLAEGKKVREIAAYLQLSPKTVEYHKYQIMNLLGLRTVAQLARYAEKQGLVD